MGTSGYVYARNLLATRVFRCPVIYFEPYVMNSTEGFARIEAGDYEGTREIHKLMHADYALGYRQDKPVRCSLPAIESR